MRYSQIFPKTRREAPKDAPSPGTRFLIQAGFIHKAGAGIWSWTPLGLRVRRKAEDIVRQEMQRIGAVEVELPILQPRSFWNETDRWTKYERARISFRLQDRTGAEYLLAPTAEEMVTEYARSYLTSHRDLPVTFWQMSPKFRDELRPRQGVVRGREFLMKDAYSFGKDDADMRAAFQAMADAYNRVFTRSGFTFVKVEADSGAIGGKGSAEFMAVTEYGEDILIRCPSCNYGANQEKATTVFVYPDEPIKEKVRLDTPNIRTVEELVVFTGIPAHKMVKTIVMMADNHPVIVSMRGDLEISEVKLANLLKAESVGTADAGVVKAVTRAPVGFAGPISLFDRERKFNDRDVPYFFDHSVKGLRNFLCGGNETDVHYIEVNTGRDFPEPPTYHDLSKVAAGMSCPSCKGRLEVSQGIELGHIFQLQQVYSIPMDAAFTAADGTRVPYWMGCYGIGVSRMVQAIVEQNYDGKGIMWPMSLAPYQIVVIPAGHAMLQAAERVYNQLCMRFGRVDEVMFDDRGERFGVAMNDADLIGYPVQIVVGRSWTDKQEIEVRLRDQRGGQRYFTGNPAGQSVDMPVDGFVSWFESILANGSNPI